MIFALRLIFAITTVGLALYGLFTGDDKLMPWMFFAMAAMFLTTAVVEFLNDRKIFGVLSLLTSAFAFYVSLSGFFLL